MRILFVDNEFGRHLLHIDRSIAVPLLIGDWITAIQMNRMEHKSSDRNTTFRSKLTSKLVKMISRGLRERKPHTILTLHAESVWLNCQQGKGTRNHHTGCGPLMV